MGLFAGVSVVSIIEVGFRLAQLSFQKAIKRINANKVHLFQSPQRPIPEMVSFHREHVLHQLLMFLYKFFKLSSIHGLRYIANKRQKVVERILWTIAVLTSLVCCSILIFNITRHSELNPIEFSVDEKLWTLKDVRNHWLSNICPKLCSFRYPFQESSFAQTWTWKNISS